MSGTAQAEHEALLQFLYAAPVGLVQTRLDGEVLRLNPMCAQLLMPLSPDGGLSNLFTALAGVAPDLRQRVRALEGSHGTVCDALPLPTRAGPGETRVLSLNLLKLDAQHLMAVISDVTQAVRRDRELRRGQAGSDGHAAVSTDYALMRLDERGCVCEWNPSIERVTGRSAEAAAGQPYSIFYPPDGLSPQQALARLLDADRSGWSLDEGWRQHGDGHRFWGSCLITPLRRADGTRAEQRAYSLILRDVSDLREAPEALRRPVDCDPLTGLSDQRAFFDAAERELQRWRRQPQPLSLVKIDADDLQRINDRHGPAGGDAVLRHLAAGMGATFRAMDVVARVGAAEFLVLLPGTPADQARALAVRLCQAIAAQPVDVDGTAVHCTVSAGVAAMDTSVDDLDGLLERADAALHAAQAAGRSRTETWRPALTRAAPPRLAPSAA
jgi:diguanylate cyclase (GGDEF)-like protein/PAS domain S-box-containing protein